MRNGDGDQLRHSLRAQRGRAVGGRTCPVVTDEHRTVGSKRLDQRERVARQRLLVGIVHGHVSRVMPPHERAYDEIPLGRDPGAHVVPVMRGVRESVHHQYQWARALLR